MKAATELWQDVTNFREASLVVLAEHSLARNRNYIVPLTVIKCMSEFGEKCISLLCLTIFIQCQVNSLIKELLVPNLTFSLQK